MTHDKVTSHLQRVNALEKVTELVQSRLVDSGWRDDVRLCCRKIITTKMEHDDCLPSVDELISKVTPEARSIVPDTVKKELLHELEIILIGVDPFVKR